VPDSIDETLDQIEKGLKTAPAIVGVVLDRSGSMAPLQKTTITSFNELLQEQQRHKVYMVLTLFDTEVDLRAAEDIAYITPWTRRTTSPGV
jgi:hypothetical protein